MSARFYKILSLVVLGHIAVLSLVWVGFPVPGPRPPARFTYEGALPAGEAGTVADNEWPKAKASGPFTFDPFDASHFSRWIGLRSPSK